MSLSLTYPGVYIQEVDSGVRTIVGVPTSITAFIGRTRRGLLNEPIRVQNFGEYDRQFGGLWEQSTVSYAVQHYFVHGGADALVVRVHRPSAVGNDDLANGALPGDGGGQPLNVEAASPGEWANQLRVIVDHVTRDPADVELFNLTVREVSAVDLTTVVDEERFLNVSIDPESPRYVRRVLEQGSNLTRVRGVDPNVRPAENPLGPDNLPIPVALNGGNDGLAIEDADIVDPALVDEKEGLWALEKADLFNLLTIPPLDRERDVDPATWATALAYCRDQRAILLVDPPAGWDDHRDVLNPATGIASIISRGENAALYFPRIRMADPLKDNRLETFAPSGAVAGVIARTDAQRGVWKAPAGQDATLNAVRALTVRLSDGENGQLNPLGVNCLRTFPVIGTVVWGARTREGADQLASQWKYLPVRRLALFIEETLYRNTQWVVFEPNDEKLWSQIRLNVGSFMHSLFRQGAFQGMTPRAAYEVRCGSDTTTQPDIDRGIVNIIVGFAPLKPAEFVVIRIRQLAGQLEV